jgi:hypothetical protein
MQGASWKFALVAALAVASVPGIAAADDYAGSRPYTPVGAYFLAGGGVTNFAEQSLRDSFKVGGTWDLRVGIGSRFFLGGELGYVGSARGADAGGFNLLSNGGEALVRVQYPYTTGGWLIEPFAFGGIGLTGLKLLDAPAGMKDSDTIGTVPFGAGLTAGYRGLLLDARFAYRPTFSDKDLPLARNGSQDGLQNWAVTASIGYGF